MPDLRIPSLPATPKSKPATPKPATPKVAVPKQRNTGYYEPGVAPLQGNPNPWRLKTEPGDDGQRIQGDQIATYIPPAGTQLPPSIPKYTTSIQSYPGVERKEVGVVKTLDEDPNAKIIEIFDPIHHTTMERPSLSYGRQGPNRKLFEKKSFFGRTKGYFGGFVDDVRKGNNQQDSVEGAITWSSVRRTQVTRSGMPKPFHPCIGPMTYYMDATLRAGHKNPFMSQ